MVVQPALPVVALWVGAKEYIVAPFVVCHFGSFSRAWYVGFTVTGEFCLITIAAVGTVNDKHGDPSAE